MPWVAALGFLLAADRTALMLGVFAAAGVSVAASNNAPEAAVLDPICLTVLAMLSALAVRRPAKASGRGFAKHDQRRADIDERSDR